MADLCDIAINEIGNNEADGSHRKYINWYGGFGNAPWCAMFVSWCVKQAGVSTPKQASVQGMLDWFRNNNSFRAKGSYAPQRNDIIIFKSNGRSHVGIVEKVSGGSVYTVEGNTSNKVAKRHYLLGNATITGYGVINSLKIVSLTGSGGSTNSSSGSTGLSGSSGSSGSTGSTSNTGNSNTTQKADRSAELALLKSVLATTISPISDVSGSVESYKSNKAVATKLVVYNWGAYFEIPVFDDIQISLERLGTPGKLTFKTQSKYKIKEGYPVLLTVDNKKIFYGFVFTIKKEKDSTLDITAYDQLRYLKNKDTYIYTKKTASQLIKMIAADYKLSCGALANTTYKMSRIEDDQTLYDTIQNALDDTLAHTMKTYVFYDNVGKLTLKNISKMIVNGCLIDEETAENYSYTTSIDSNTYNQIKLAYENTETGKLETFVVRDKKNINAWGLLQYFEKIDDPKLGKTKANALAILYNKKTKNLSISGAIGNTSVRAGSLIPVLLDLGDVKVQNYMLVEKVIHKFSNRSHKMDLTLTGGDFSA